MKIVRSVAHEPTGAHALDPSAQEPGAARSL